MEALIEPLFAALLGSGPAGLVAAFEFFIILALGGGLWHFIKQRNGHAALTKQHASELKRTQETHISTIGDLHAGYQKQLADLNGERVADIKEMSEDYSELAEKMTETMVRLTAQLEVRGSKRGSG